MKEKVQPIGPLDIIRRRLLKLSKYHISVYLGRDSCI